MDDDPATIPDPTAALAPAERHTAAETLANRIITAIAVGEFQPHQRLPAERDLAESLGLSRSTVRAALALVADSGLVQIRRGRTGGTFVTEAWGERTAGAVEQILQPQWEQLEQLMDMRHLVEATIARTAAERRVAADVRAIRAALADYESAGDLRAAQQADLRLHDAVAAATHNDKLLALHTQLLAEASLGFSIEPFTTPIYDQALPEHQQLAAAVIAADPDTAWDIGRRHFAITTDEVRAALRRARDHLRDPS